MHKRDPPIRFSPDRVENNPALILKQHGLASENGDASEIAGIHLFVFIGDLKWAVVHFSF